VVAVEMERGNMHEAPATSSMRILSGSHNRTVPRSGDCAHNLPPVVTRSGPRVYGPDMTDYVPSRGDRFSFGLWTVGWPARDMFGDASRPPLDPVDAFEYPTKLGAYEVIMHRNDTMTNRISQQCQQRENNHE